MSIRASLKQLIILVMVTIHQNSHILNWSQIVTSYCPFEMLLESRNYVLSTGSEKLAHPVLNISCSGRQDGELLFYLANLKLVSRPTVFILGFLFFIFWQALLRLIIEGGL